MVGVAMVFEHKKVEAEVEKLWAKNKKQIENSIQNDKKKKLFSFLEGPPTANAPPGLHHLEVRVFKDLFCRYKYMQGFSVPRKGGWDCHGLPVEVQVEKKLGLQTKKDVVKYGIEKFCATCRNDVFSFVNDWSRFTEKSGFWIDLKNPYKTLDNNYIESVWWSLKELWKKRLLYEGHKVVPYCPRCETALSTHELALGYEEVEVESFTAKFKVRGESDMYFLGWTTTPWTTPANVTLAVNPNIVYAFVQRGNEVFILAKNRIEYYFGKPEGNIKIVKEVKGKDLDGIEYEPLFDYFIGKFERPAWFVILADYVTDKDGTGIVHTAPAFGDVDYHSGKKYKLPFVQPVTRDGKFTEDVRDFAGKFVIDADKEIIELLAEQNKVFSVEKIKHDYPFCWRCKSPLIYNAMISWFIAVSKFRRQLIKKNKKINWFPDYIKYGRFGNWLEEAKDWALSRSKFWGTPLPVWRCTKCKHDVCIGSVAELKKRSITRLKNIDLHKPYVDKIEFKCEKCGSLMVRIPDVIDCWYDSGSAPFAQFHYPFENKDFFKKSFPYDFIAEAIDQTRGWFYTLHVLGTLLFGKPAYKSVVCAGHIVDDRGEKMSKSKGNIINPWDMFDRYGVDATRLLMVSSAPSNTKRVGPRTIEEVSLHFLNILWNSFLFARIYSEQKLYKGKLKLEDKWLLSRANSLIADVTSNLEKHEYQNCHAALQNFVVNDLSHWYIKLLRERSDRTALFVLKQTFDTLARLLAPFAPYIADYLYNDFVNKKSSVHFQKWPSKMPTNKKLEMQMNIIRQIVEASNALRLEKGLRLKYPLKSLTVMAAPQALSAARSLSPVLCAMANIKRVKFGRIKRQYSVKPNWAVIGKRLGKKIKKIAKELESLDAAELKARIDKKKFAMIAGEKVLQGDLIFAEKVLAEGKDFHGGKILLDTTVDEILRQEWLVRELVRAVQDKRKTMDMKVKDKIMLYLPPEKGFKNFAKLIAECTGSSVHFGALAGSQGTFVFENNEYKFGVVKK